jgi:hypothetical protein
MRLASAALRALLALAPLATHPGEFYVDPVAGADDGDGSAARPWKNLQDVVDLRVETRNWESLPYTGKRLVAKNAGAPVTAGATIWLRSGDYGALTVQSAYNTAAITLAVEAGAEARFTRVRVVSAQNWVLRGFSVSPAHGSTPSAETIVTVEDHDWSGPASDVVIDGFDVFTVPDERVWTTRSDWDTQAASGILADGDRVTVRGCRVRNVGYGISVTGVGSRVEHNLVDGFCGDGLRGLGDDEVFEYNLVKNARDVNDDHRDGFQSWSYGSGGVGTGVVRNVTLRGNVIIGYDDPSVPFAGTLQGIGCFDGTYEGWLVENNVVITDHWHGISFYGARDVRIVNNTVLDLASGDPGPPWIMVTDHKDGTPSTSSLVRNNLAATFNVEGEGVVSDHNLELPGDVSAYFVDPAHHDLRLLATSPAVDQGAADGAPAADADGVARPAGAAVDVGAFEYAPGAPRPEGGNAGPGGTVSAPTSGAGSSGRASGCGQAGQDGAVWLAAAWLLLRAARRTARGAAPAAAGARC